MIRRGLAVRTLAGELAAAIEWCRDTVCVDVPAPRGAGVLDQYTFAVETDLVTADRKTNSP
jgi:hypothetical protein